MEEEACDAWFQARGLVAHQLDSFNRFCGAGAHSLALLFGSPAHFTDIKGEVRMAAMPPCRDPVPALTTIRIRNLVLHKPADATTGRPLFPREARLRGITYSARLCADVELQVGMVDAVAGEQRNPVVNRVFPAVHIGDIPIMVNSLLCNGHDADAFDCGGYFIVKGVDKVVLAQELVWPQALRVLCPKTGSDNWRVELEQVKVELERGDGVLLLSAPGLDTIPLVIVLAALGVSTDRQLLEVMVHDTQDVELTELVRPSIVHAREQMQEFVNSSGVHGGGRDVTSVAVELVGSRIKSVTPLAGPAQEKLGSLLCNTSSSRPADKALLMGYMVRCLCLCVVGRSTADDIHSLKNKRVDLAGDCMFKQMRHLSARFRKTTLKRVLKHVEAGGLDCLTDNLIVDKSVITNGLRAAFSTGIWSLNRYSSCTSGVVATLQRDNPMHTLSQLRQLRSASRFVANAARLPNASHYGRICPVETPDDHLAKTMAVFATVSAPRSHDNVLEQLSHCQMQSSQGPLVGWDNVFVNGQWVGATDKPGTLLQAMRNLRRNKLIHPETELARAPSRAEIRIFTDGGRLLRPLLVVDKQRVLLSTREHRRELRARPAHERFDYMLDTGLVELLGAQEESNAVIAVTRREAESSSSFTHVEMHPASLLGVSASAIPFLNHNQSARVTHQAQKHGKQAIGFYTCDILSRMDTNVRQLYYPQQPLVCTRLAQLLARPELANGVNCVVAVACYGGYNQEDSLILNQSSLDRGLFRSTHFRVHRATLDYSSSDIRFCRPETEVARSNSDGIDKLDSDGLPFIGAEMKAADVVIGKAGRRQASKLVDHSSKLRKLEQGWVDQVVCSGGDEEGERHVRVRLREARCPQVGDKFSSMHGQKGVVGMKLRQEELLFTQQGIVPDVVINPHAFPSRQTLAQMLESVVGKAVAASCARVQATPFAHPRAEEIAQHLATCGYNKWGQERVYSGRTGRMMEAMATVGLTFYQRLHHLSEDKMKWRGASGPVHPLTHQPVKDRKREGGTKFGEMERDCLISHGASATVKERLFFVSDRSLVPVCTNCHRLAILNCKQHPRCLFCNPQQRIATLDMPHACKLLSMELRSMGVDMRFRVSQH
ncbi:DNA-directed RNA polymerases IV and V subunit 2 [Selaginella moellendorffii]|uniref:DNA-directed RNA polymerases IV and V subunit 2 n=1 Tax=Selaginella moellendorffii TaxID=88036 RepID=UPI000D1CC4DF|nr:DNA-directed RNA polymerases IV and V subunit 2 [Selaginella moellendorffii]|eukprot:XP_024514894.1 DNA-directed RNA polymerases IV and V subunit 2 [Selaginella moellendorffii]